MSLKKAIEDLIRELQHHRGTSGPVGGGGGPSDSSGRRPPTRRSSTGGSGIYEDVDEDERQKRKYKELQEGKPEAWNKIKNMFTETAFYSAEKATELFNAQLQQGLTLDQTNIERLLIPINRQIDRLKYLRIAEKAVFDQTGESVVQLSDRFGLAKSEMDEFGAESEKLYGSAKAGYEVYADLTKEFGGFLAVGKNNRQNIANTVMAMNRLGFSTQGTSTILDNATRSLGMTGEGANKTILRLAGLRKEFNIGAKEITDNYILAQEKLLYNTAKVDRIFADLQRTSRISGVEFNTLIQKFGEGFDTFEGAAQKAGGLNALLGGNVFNSLDLLEKDESERLATLVDGIRSKVNVSALVADKYNLKAVANQLGLSPDQTRRLLLGETSVAKALEKAIPSGADALRGQNKAMGTALHDLRKTFDDARGPLAKSILEMANTFSKAFEETKFPGFSPFGGTAMRRLLDSQRTLPSGADDLEGLVPDLWLASDRMKRSEGPLSTGTFFAGAPILDSAQFGIAGIGAGFASAVMLEKLGMLNQSIAALTLVSSAAKEATEQNTDATKKSSQRKGTKNLNPLNLEDDQQ